MTTATYTFDNDIAGDLHKDAYGFRPHSSWWAAWAIMSDAEKQQEWDQLVESMKTREASRIECEQQAIVRFETLVTKTVTAGAASRADAIKWLMQGEEVNGDTNYFEYLMGIPYGHVVTTTC